MMALNAFQSFCMDIIKNVYVTTSWNDFNVMTHKTCQNVKSFTSLTKPPQTLFYLQSKKFNVFSINLAAPRK